MRISTLTLLSLLSLGGCACEAPCDAPIVLTCPPAQRLECTSARTAALLATPTLTPECARSSVSEITSNAPAEGFARGTTNVVFTAASSRGPSAQCTTSIEVVDTLAPTITCPPSTTIVRTSATSPITVPAITARDACATNVEVSLAPMPTMRGRANVIATASDGTNRAQCMLDVNVLDVFAPTELRTLSATRTPAGATDVTIGWRASTGADAPRVRIERATAEAGPWMMLAESPSTTVTFTDRTLPAPVVFYRLTALGPAGELGGQTEPMRVYAIDETRYELPTQTVPGVPFPTTLYGVVRMPIEAATSPRPFVLFLHGNHGNCRPADGTDDQCGDITEYACTEPGYTTTPNAEGYIYLQEMLAAQGIVSVSISANALNCRELFIAERTQLLLEHLRRWQRWSSSDEAPFSGRFRNAIDMMNVGLVGHSRGGEAVSQAPQALTNTPIAGVSLTSVFALAPTDYQENSPRGVPYLVLLPGCDGDVEDLQGLRMYDRGLSMNAFERTQLLFARANHNYFNSEWRFDDNRGTVCRPSDQITASQQRAGLEVLLGDWIRTTSARTRALAYMRTDEETPSIVEAWAGAPLDFRFSYASPTRTSVDDFSRAGFTTNALGQSNEFAGYTADLRCVGACAGNYPHVRGGARLAWDAAPATATFQLAAFDASAEEAIALRVASRIATINDGLVEQSFTVRVRDAAGVSASIPIADIGRVAHRYPASNPIEVLSTLRIPLARIRALAPTLNLTRLDAIELVMPSPEQPRGSIWISDVEFQAP